MTHGPLAWPPGDPVPKRRLPRNRRPPWCRCRRHGSRSRRCRSRSSTRRPGLFGWSPCTRSRAASPVAVPFAVTTRAAGASGTIAHAGLDQDPVDRVAVERRLEGGGDGRVVGSGLHTADGRRFEVILHRGLVVDDRDGAGAARAEGILRGGVGVAAGQTRYPWSCRSCRSSGRERKCPCRPGRAARCSLGRRRARCYAQQRRCCRRSRRRRKVYRPSSRSRRCRSDPSRRCQCRCPPGRAVRRIGTARGAAEKCQQDATTAPRDINKTRIGRRNLFHCESPVSKFAPTGGAGRPPS